MSLQFLHIAMWIRGNAFGGIYFPLKSWYFFVKKFLNCVVSLGNKYLNLITPKNQLEKKWPKIIPKALCKGIKIHCLISQRIFLERIVLGHQSLRWTIAIDWHLSLSILSITIHCPSYQELWGQFLPYVVYSISRVRRKEIVNFTTLTHPKGT